MRWRAIIGQQRHSKLAVAAFCRQQSVPPSSFFAWRRRLLGNGKARHIRGAGFAEVKLVQEPSLALPSADASLDLRLRGSRRVIVRRGFDQQLLIEVVRVLEGLA